MIAHRHIRLDERALHYLVAVQECGSMRLAAERIRISVSAISRKLAELEFDLGIPLFEKSQKGVRVTAEGARLADYIQERNRRDRELLVELASGHSLRGEVRVALGEGFLAGAIERVLPAFRDAFPQVRVHLDVAGSEEIVEAVERDVVDIGILFGQPSPASADILLRATHALLLVGERSETNGKNKCDLGALGDTPVALLSHRFGIRSLVERAQREAGIKLNVVLEANSIRAAEMFAMSGQGVTFLPQFALQIGGSDAPHMIEPRLAHVPAELLVRHNRDLTPSTRALIMLFASNHLAFTGCVAEL